MSTDKTSSGTATVIGIAIAFSIYGALIRVLLRLGEASPLCTDASLLSRVLAIYADVGALVVLPLAIAWWEGRKDPEISRSALWRGLGIALPLLIVFYALFTVWRHPCVFGW